MGMLENIESDIDAMWPHMTIDASSTRRWSSILGWNIAQLAHECGLPYQRAYYGRLNLEEQRMLARGLQHAIEETYGDRLRYYLRETQPMAALAEMAPDNKVVHERYEHIRRYRQMARDIRSGFDIPAEWQDGADDTVPAVASAQRPMMRCPRCDYRWRPLVAKPKYCPNKACQQRFRWDAETVTRRVTVTEELPALAPTEEPE